MMRVRKSLPAQRASTRRRMLIAPLSPVGLAVISYVFFIACIVFPPRSYEAIMGEPDWMFLDSTSLVFVTLCVFGYMAGVVLIRTTTVGRSKPMRVKFLGQTAILLPLLFAFTLNLVSVSLIANSTPNLFTAWFVDGSAAKTNLDTAGALTQALPLLYGLCWWTLWQIINREQANRFHNTGLRFTLWAVFATALATAVIKVARYDLIPMILGIAMIYFTSTLLGKRISVVKYIARTILLVLIIIVLFVAFSWLRGSDSQSVLLKNAAGYTVASYNRLAGVLNGEIRLPYGGTGTYAFRFLSNLPILNRWIVSGMPDSANVLHSEFAAVGASGLDGAYIWSSAFGYVYSDMGWAAPAYFCVIGALSAWAWRRLRAGSAMGVLIYPWLAFSIIFWAGSNIVSYPQFVTMVGAGTALSVYERLAARRIRAAVVTITTRASTNRMFSHFGE